MILLACGGKSLDGDDSGTGDGGGSDSSPPGPNCPVTQPAEGSSCKINELQCEYGSDIRSSCNTVTTCFNGSWTLPKGIDPTCPTTANDPTCPSSASQAVGTCSDMGLSCNYSTSSQTRFCTCNYLGGPPMEDGGFQPSWECSFGTTTGCPSVRPKIGATCTEPNLDCTYDVCGAPQGLSFQCSAKTGTWIEGFGDVCAGAN
jgi:hypothetical protein